MCWGELGTYEIIMSGPPADDVVRSPLSGEEENLKRLVTVRGNHVHFYATVTNESVRALMDGVYSVKDKTVAALTKAAAGKDIEGEDALILGNGAGLVDPVPGLIDVYIHISTEGGSYSAGMACYDSLMAFKMEGVRIVTIAEGFVFSAGSVIYLAGDVRFVGPSALLLLHQVSGSFEGGTFEDMKAESQNLRCMMRVLKNVYEDRCSIPKNVLTAYLKRDIMIGAADAKKHGVAHLVLGEKPSATRDA